MSSVRERVKAIQKQLRDGAPSPEQARNALMILTGLSGNISEEYRAAEMEYKPVLLKFLQSGGAANRAKIEAECSGEYARLKEAKDTQELVKQMMVTCRAYLRSLDEEMRLSR